MRIRTVLSVAAVLATTLVVLPLAGVASAQPTDRDCRDFASQAAAQSALRSGSGDPARLDPDGDGVACEAYFTVPGAPALDGRAPGGPAPGGPVPSGPVPSGPAPDGPAPDGTVPPPAPAAALEPVADTDPAPRAVVPALADPGTADATPAALADPAAAPVRTVPQPQILVKPQGAPDTGDGSSAPLDGTPLVLLVGGLGAVAAVGAARRPGGRTR